MWTLSDSKLPIIGRVLQTCKSGPVKTTSGFPVNKDEKPEDLEKLVREQIAMITNEKILKKTSQVE